MDTCFCAPVIGIFHKRLCVQFFQAFLALHYTGRLSSEQQAQLPEQLLEQAELRWHLSASVTRISQFHVVRWWCVFVIPNGY